MATARKLPSGKWRVRIYIKGHSPEYVSFTSEGSERRDKTVVESEATDYKLAWEKLRKKSIITDITLGDAIDRYIESKSAILSPSTIKEYKKIRRIHFSEIIGKRLPEISPEDVQVAVNAEAKIYSPKTVKNVYGLLSVALREYCPDFQLRIKLPAKKKKEIIIPEDGMIQAMLDSAGPYLKAAMIIAAFGGLRRSEICALTCGDINGNTLRIDKAIVLDDNKQWVVKGTKSYESTRTIHMPKFAIDILLSLPKNGGRIIPLYPANISNQFCRLRDKLGFSFRFHDLRHYHASIMLSLGVPDKYAMERMGHSTATMLKTVYQHTIKSKEDEFSARLNEHFRKVYDTEYDTESPESS